MIVRSMKPTDSPSTLPETLRKWRGERTVNAAALALGVHWATYNGWEEGATSPKPRDLAYLTQVLGDDVMAGGN